MFDRIGFMFSKLRYLVKETWQLIKKEKVLFLFPLIIILILLSLLIFNFGSIVVVSFIYAGI